MWEPYAGFVEGVRAKCRGSKGGCYTVLLVLPSWSFAVLTGLLPSARPKLSTICQRWRWRRLEPARRPPVARANLAQHGVPRGGKPLFRTAAPRSASRSWSRAAGVGDGGLVRRLRRALCNRVCRVYIFMGASSHLWIC